MNGYGNISWWGFSPSLNLLDFLPPSDDTVAMEECNILLVNNHDPRNIIHTICNFTQNKSLRHTKLNFYVLEPFVEQVGRYMLLLNIIFDESFGLQEKIETFLETYGNTLLRNPTSDYITQQSKKFVDAVTDLDYCKEVFPLYDLSLLKHKERDYLEGTFKFWRGADNRNYEIHKMWDFRNREYLGPRYDVKENAYDWDRIMKLHERGAYILHKLEYESFRSKGIAFESRSGDYNLPNRTLSSPIVVTDAKADRVMKRGYFGDIVTGPFTAFGVESNNEELFKKANNQYTKMSLDVSTYNLQQLLRNLKCHQNSSTDDCCSNATIAEVDENESELSDTQSSDLSNISIKFVYGNEMKYFVTKEKFRKFFNVVHLASDSAQFLQDSILPILAPNSSLLVESPKYIIDLKKDQVASILNTLVGRGTKLGLEVQPKQHNVNFDEKPFDLNFLHFKFC